MPTHSALDQLLRGLQLGVDPSELHGALCGFLCAGGEASEHGWLEQLALQADRKDHEVEMLLDLFRVSAAQLLDPQFGFELLLPEDERPLRDRVDAVITWARGFLGGFGLAAGARPALSAEGDEALRDIGRIAEAAPSCDDPDSDDESLAEIVEFLRVAAMLLMSDRPEHPGGSQSVH
nr:UPF0149 family protein [Pseudomarimonas arenosa]